MWKTHASPGGPGTIRHPHSRCDARSVLGRGLSRGVTRGRLLPRETAESSSPCRGAQDVIVTLEDTTCLVSHECASPLLRGGHVGAGTPICWCRVVALGLLGAGEKRGGTEKDGVCGGSLSQPHAPLPCHALGSAAAFQLPACWGLSWGPSMAQPSAVPDPARGGQRPQALPK